MLEDYQKVKTPKDLYELIQSDLFIQNEWNYRPRSSLGGSPQHEAQQAAIRIREENTSLGLPQVPSSGNTVDLQNWCIDAQKIMDEATSSRPDAKQTIPTNGDKTGSTNKPQEKDGQGNGGKAGDRKRGTPETTELKFELLRDQVFICYSHKDKRWLDDLQTHLKPHVRNGSITAWSDKQIVPGSKWFSEIKVALAATKVAVLLVTPHFLASDFIHEHELTPILKEVEKSNVCIIWIPVRACSYKETALKDYQAAIDPDKPLANMKAERDGAWVRICEEIKKAFSR